MRVPDARRNARRLAWASLLLVLAPASAPAGVDSVRVHGDAGLGYDLTNQIYFEQTFDSTAFTGRETVSDPEGRVQGLGEGRLELFYGGHSRLRLENRVSAGDELLRNTLRADWRQQLSNRWRWVAVNELDYRRDRTFTTQREDLREAARLGFERRSADLSTIFRTHYRFDLAETDTEDGTSFYPDYRFHRVTLGLDHFDWRKPEWGINFTAGYRSFPDTSVRNYFDHTLDGRLRLRSERGTELELSGLVNRRDARRDSAVGDHFFYGEAELRYRVPIEEHRWSFGWIARFQGTGYDEPTPTYFHNILPRAELNLRFERFPDWTVTTRLEGEALRIPRGGGLGDPATDEDAANAVREEYDQIALRADLERMGRAVWFFVTPAIGRRMYRVESDSEDDLLARSSYWFFQAGSFVDARLTPVIRLRISADLLHERHDVASDDLTSLFLATELRYVFFD